MFKKITKRSKRNRIILLIVNIFLLIYLTGCDEYSHTAVVGIPETGHVKQLPQYNSPYTICYENRDGTYSMYIFSAPIQYKTDTGEYALIDNTVVESSKDGFAYENKANTIKTYFPKSLQDFFRVEEGSRYIAFLPEDIEGFSEAKHVSYTNMYGTIVDAVRYEREDMDYVFYPVRSGIKMEVVLKEEPKSNSFTYFVQTYAKMFENQQNGYVLFKNGSTPAALVYQPLVQYQTGKEGTKLDISSTMDVDGGTGFSIIHLYLDPEMLENADVQYPIKFDPSFELYCNKIPDTSVYSGTDTNSYLRHYAVIGEHPQLGEGWEYIRLRLNYLMTVSPESIQSAAYYAKRLWGDSSLSKSQAYIPAEQWSSTQMLWTNRSLPSTALAGKTEIRNGYIRLSMDEFIRDCARDPNWETESIGFLMKMEEPHLYGVLSSSDHSLYSTFLEITLSEPPAYFEAKENINENIL